MRIPSSDQNPYSPPPTSKDSLPLYDLSDTEVSRFWGLSDYLWASGGHMLGFFVSFVLTIGATRAMERVRVDLAGFTLALVIYAVVPLAASAPFRLLRRRIWGPVAIPAGFRFFGAFTTSIVALGVFIQLARRLNAINDIAISIAVAAAILLLAPVLGVELEAWVARRWARRTEVNKLSRELDAGESVTS